MPTKKKEEYKTDHPRRVAFYVPSESNYISEAEKAEKHGPMGKAVRNFLTRSFGGATKVQVSGTFHNKKVTPHEIQDEVISYYYAFGTDEELKIRRVGIGRMANAICIEFGQETVAVELDSVYSQYTPTAEYRRRYAAFRNDYQRGAISDMDTFLQHVEMVDIVKFIPKSSRGSR